VSYMVRIADRAGIYADSGYESFEEALEATIQLRESSGPSKIACLYNAELMDQIDTGQWFDGLTDAERDALLAEGI
jgi:hypothetical protein